MPYQALFDLSIGVIRSLHTIVIGFIVRRPSTVNITYGASTATDETHKDTWGVWVCVCTVDFHLKCVFVGARVCFCAFLSTRQYFSVSCERIMNHQFSSLTAKQMIFIDHKPNVVCLLCVCVRCTRAPRCVCQCDYVLSIVHSGPDRCGGPALFAGCPLCVQCASITIMPSDELSNDSDSTFGYLCE